MKKSSLLFAILAAALAFNACSTDVDLYSDYKDITVVYGLLNAKEDTNYVKINKAFLGPGNAMNIALIADSCNYPGKLDVRMMEYKASLGNNHYQKIDEFQLDTITIHDKNPGIFYAPDQLVYFTDHKIKANDDRFKYRYDLYIDRGDTILTSSTEVVGGGTFNVQQSVLNFASNVDMGAIKWYEAPNAVVYDVNIEFHYFEIGPSHDSIEKVMKWSLGTHSINDLSFENGCFSTPYKASLFFSNLAMELGSDTLDRTVERVFFEPSLRVSLAAGGNELYNFISVNAPSSSIVQNIPEYTNINGGYGVFSSRAFVTKKLKLSSQTVMELIAHDNWNFRQGR